MQDHRLPALPLRNQNRATSSRNAPMVRIEAIFVGEPKNITDERGTWLSAIYRSRVEGAIELLETGLVGDRVADTKHHGRPGQAVCVHPIVHYDFWNQAYDLKGVDRLGPGSVGENWTISGADEATVPRTQLTKNRCELPDGVSRTLTLRKRGTNGITAPPLSGTYNLRDCMCWHSNGKPLPRRFNSRSPAQATIILDSNESRSNVRSRRFQY
jgi:hypothetical protein